MSNKDYKQIILDGLLKKYNNRYAKNIITNRRIILKPKEVYKDYDRNNADILEKQGINEAVTVLTDMGFVTADYLKFSDDIEKIYFSEEKLNAVYEYLKEEYGVIPQSIISKMYYWSVGKDITERRADSKWGNKFFQNMSMDMSDMIPNAKGFSPTNLRYMMRFYGLYKDIVIVPQVGERLLENNGNQIVPQVEED